MIKIICLGKIKEAYLKALIEDYTKRISRYHKIEIIELKDEDSLEKEEKSIMSHLDSKDFLITLEIEGHQLSSPEFAKFLDDTFITHSNLTFIIGSSLGLPTKIKAMSNYALSFSRLTFPHGLFRGILLEQIYRAFKINNNESYHK